MKYKLVDLYDPNFAKMTDMQISKDQTEGLTLQNKKGDLVVNIPTEVKPLKVIEKQGFMGKDEMILYYFLTPTGFFNLEDQKLKGKLTFEAKEYQHSSEFIKHAWSGGLFRAFFKEFALEDNTNDMMGMVKILLILAVLGFIGYYVFTNVDLGSMLGGVGV